MIVVSDTSPISNLMQIGRVELLVDLFGRVIIPPVVARELEVEHGSLPAFLQVIGPTNAREVRRLTGLLDSG